MKHTPFDRRDFLKLSGVGGAVLASGLGPWGQSLAASGEDFFFVQMTDTHWGFEGPPNPEARNTLRKAVAAVNSLERQPDFIMFTGDLTHAAADDKERQRRMTEFKAIVGELKVKDVRFIPGENDAGLDNGEMYQQVFGKGHYSFKHKGVHFVALDNVSDPNGLIGEQQLEWLHADLARLDKTAPVVVFAHRPLFDMYPAWDWATKDGAKAIDILTPYQNTTVFFGHIHQEHHQMTGRIAHHAAESLIFPFPLAGSQPKRTPVAWDAARPFKGLGFSQVDEHAGTAQPKRRPLA
ncbi:metallophosphoesterase [Curvibacter gracilis]|uniref:metallophosphoesterase n=1 Tax=Curvibacter gracilis TaxID=230310 RepID=UPI0004BC05B4|nr:metallophosphoesterase [Curvibacter gracilis]